MTYHKDTNWLIVKLPTGWHEIAVSEPAHEVRDTLKAMGITRDELLDRGTQTQHYPTGAKQPDVSYTNPSIRRNMADWSTIVDTLRALLV
jgi:hypothetical protein